jgi:3D (Asp-Asp-Asp) domain-containing protein
VEEILADLGVKLGVLDRTEPDLKSRLADGDALKIVRVKRELAEVEREIPFETVTREDKSMSRGKQKVVQEGEPGVLLELVEHVYEDGQLVATRVIDSTIKSPGKEQIVAVGAKREVAVLSANSPNIETITKNGIQFGVKKILNNVTLTIYDSGPESTGKDEGHPLYGITYTGTKVEEGRTIAVDPSVIPLGWWVYIEGVGFRKAEDTGSAIKGNKIDVYFDDADEAPFGKKRGVTVYIIGPDKPEGL